MKLQNKVVKRMLNSFEFKKKKTSLSNWVSAGRTIIVNLTLDQLEDKQTMLTSNLNI